MASGASELRLATAAPTVNTSTNVPIASTRYLAVARRLSLVPGRGLRAADSYEALLVNAAVVPTHLVSRLSRAMSARVAPEFHARQRECRDTS